MHKLTANTDGLTEVAASQQGSTDLEIRAEQIATAAMGELYDYLTPLLFMRVVGLVVCLSLRMANVADSRHIQYSVVSVIFYC